MGIQALSLFLVAYRYVRFVQNSRLLTRISLLKFLFVDAPQQVAVILYLNAWYAKDGQKNAAGGDVDDALSWSNFALLLSLILSAASTQMLVVEKGKNTCDPCGMGMGGIDDEEEFQICCMSLWRLTAFAVATLPLTIAFLAFGQSTFLRLHSHPGIYVFVILNAFMGWIGLCILIINLLVPAEDLDDDDDDITDDV